MEGILLDTSVFSSTVAILGGVAILAIAVVTAVLESVAEREAQGRRVSWAEWPLPESEPKAPAKEAEKVPRAA